MRKTILGIVCPEKAWESYVKNIVDNYGCESRQIIRQLVLANKDSPGAINHLREIFKYRTDILGHLEKLLTLV